MSDAFTEAVMKLFREGDGARAMEVVCGTIESQGRRLSILESRAGGEAGKDGELLPITAEELEAEWRAVLASMSGRYSDNPQEMFFCGYRNGAARRSGGASAQLIEDLRMAYALLESPTEGTIFDARLALRRALAQADRSPADAREVPGE